MLEIHAGLGKSIFGKPKLDIVRARWLLSLSCIKEGCQMIKKWTWKGKIAIMRQNEISEGSLWGKCTGAPNLGFKLGHFRVLAPLCPWGSVYFFTTFPNSLLYEELLVNEKHRTPQLWGSHLRLHELVTPCWWRCNNTRLQVFSWVTQTRK